MQNVDLRNKSYKQFLIKNKSGAVRKIEECSSTLEFFLVKYSHISISVSYYFFQ